MFEPREITAFISAETIRRYLVRELSDQVQKKITPRIASELVHAYTNKPDSLSPRLISIIGQPEIYNALFIYSSLGKRSIPPESIKRVDRMKRVHGKRRRH